MQINKEVLIKQIKDKVDEVQLKIDKDNDQLTTTELIGEREGLELALEIINQI